MYNVEPPNHPRHYRDVISPEHALTKSLFGEQVVKRKSCGKCKKVKILSEFYLLKGEPRSWCITCWDEDTKKREKEKKYNSKEYKKKVEERRKLEKKRLEETNIMRFFLVNNAT